MFQYYNENTSRSDDLFELISSQKWRKLKVYIPKNKNIAEAYHAQCTGTSILNVNKCLYHCNSRHNALLYACYFHPPLEVVKCLYYAYPKAIQDQDCKGCFPLHIACSNGCKPEVIKFLIQQYPQAMWETDVNNRNPIFHVCKSYASKSNKRCKKTANKDLYAVLELLGSFAPMSFITEDKCGKTPLDYLITAEAHPLVVDYVRSIYVHLRREMIKGGKNKQEV